MACAPPTQPAAPLLPVCPMQAPCSAAGLRDEDRLEPRLLRALCYGCYFSIRGGQASAADLQTMARFSSVPQLGQSVAVVRRDGFLEAYSERYEQRDWQGVRLAQDFAMQLPLAPSDAGTVYALLWLSEEQLGWMFGPPLPTQLVPVVPSSKAGATLVDVSPASVTLVACEGQRQLCLHLHLSKALKVYDAVQAVACGAGVMLDDGVEALQAVSCGGGGGGWMRLAC